MMAAFSLLWVFFEQSLSNKKELSVSGDKFEMLQQIVIVLKKRFISTAIDEK